MTKVKLVCKTLAEHPVFYNVIIALILLNALLVGLETYPYIATNYASYIYVADRILLWVFTVEIMIRMIGSQSIAAFFKDPWSLFDFIIVMAGHILVGAYYVMVLRILRVLRVLRAISIVPSLRRMVNALLLTIPSMGTILLLLSLFFLYIWCHRYFFVSVDHA